MQPITNFPIIQQFLSVLITFMITFYFFKSIKMKKNADLITGITFFFILILIFIEKVLLFGVDDFGKTLPLHLCDLTFVLCTFSFLFQTKKFLPIIFFTSIGALLAIVFPVYEIQELNLLNIVSLTFYLEHVIILYSTWIIFKRKDYLINNHNWLKVSFYILGTGFILLFINPLLDSNYFFVSEALDMKLYDYFFPWPYFLLEYAILTFIFTFFWGKFLMILQKR